MAAKLKPLAASHLLRSASVLVLLLSSAAAGAQSDGSLEEAYASQCPQHQDTQICNTLRDAMESSVRQLEPAHPTGDAARGGTNPIESSAGKAAKSSLGLELVPISASDQQALAQFGFPIGVGRQVGTVFAGGAAGIAGVWKHDYLLSIDGRAIGPGEDVEDIVSAYPIGRRVSLEIWRRGSRQTLWATLKEPVPLVEDLTTVKPPLMINGDVSDPDAAKAGFAAIDALGQFLDGIWVLDMSDSPLIDYVRFSWDSSSQQLKVQRGMTGADFGRPDEMTLAYLPSDRSLRGKQHYGLLPGRHDIVWRMPAQKLLVSDRYARFNDKKYPTRTAFKVVSPDRITEYHSEGQAVLWQSGTYVRVAPGDPEGRLAQARAKGQNWFGQWQAEQQAKKQQKGSSGLFGALAAGFGAALAGGNAEMVMGAAMKGAELTTDNETTRNVLAGQGDQMIASGFDRMAANNALRNGNASGSAGGGSSYQASSAAAGPIDFASGRASAGATEASARRTISGWCYATKGGQAVYMSGVGSRGLSVDEQEQWRSAMLAEFKQQISGSYDSAQCDIDDDGDFSYTRGNVESHNPAQVPWSPH